MSLSLIEYGTKKYREMVTLREKILRKPLGLTFTEEDLTRDQSDLLCGCYDDSDVLIGTCIISRLSENVVQLRQMAIDLNCQGKNVGNKLLDFAEKTAIENGYRSIYLHARKTAIGFYLKSGYEIIGEEYIEVGIPHVEMIKDLSVNKEY